MPFGAFLYAVYVFACPFVGDFNKFDLFLLIKKGPYVMQCKKS